jgi:hypothetical protein
VIAAAYPGLPNVQFPVLGNKWAVGVFFLLHVAIGSFTMGTLVLGPTYELIGRWRGSGPCLRYARWLAEINLRIFSLGATLAGFAVIFLLGLYGRFFVPLVEGFWLVFLIAFLIWFPAIAALWAWTHWWDRWVPSGAHIALGYFAAAMDHVFLFLIVGIDSFLLTPGSGSGPQAFFNASFWPELAHRFVGNISWASFLLAGICALLAGATPRATDRDYFLWAARSGLLVGFLTLIPQALIGFGYAEAVHSAEPSAFTYSFEGPLAWLWLLQGGLLGVLLVATNLFFRQDRPVRAGNLLTLAVLLLELGAVLPEQVYGRTYFWFRYVLITLALLLTLLHWLLWRSAAELAIRWRPRNAATLAAAGIAAVGLIFVMGIIRTTARDPYTIEGQLSQGQSEGVFAPPPGHYP